MPGGTVRLWLLSRSTWSTGTCTKVIQLSSYKVQVGSRQYRCNPHQLLKAEEPPPSSDQKLPVSLDPDKQTQELPEESTITDNHLMWGDYQEEPVGETRPPDISMLRSEMVCKQRGRMSDYVHSWPGIQQNSRETEVNNFCCCCSVLCVCFFFFSSRFHFLFYLLLSSDQFIHVIALLSTLITP